MAQDGSVSKLFGALVIGGSMLLPGCAGKAIEAAPNEGGEPAGAGAEAASAVPPLPGAIAPVTSHEVAHCQMEFSLSSYDSDGIRAGTNTICLDEKTDEEILTVIKEARKEPCKPAFCGCWLG